MAYSRGATATAVAHRSHPDEPDDLDVPYKEAEHLVELLDFLIAAGVCKHHAAIAARVFHEQKVRIPRLA